MSDGKNASLERFWDSAAQSANVCASLAKALPGTQRDNAYCFGLFHDCGIPIMLRRFPDYKDTLRLANADASHGFTRIEEARHGTHHAVIGHLVSRNWGLTPAISQAILCHHDMTIFENDDGLEKEALTLVAFCHIADHVTSQLLRNRSESEWDLVKARIAGFFGISLVDLQDLIDDQIFLFEQRKAA